MDQLKITTLTSQEFNQDVSKAMRAAKNGPVFVTNRGRISHILLSIEHHRAIIHQSSSIVDKLALPEMDEIEFEPARITGVLWFPADFS